MPAIARTVVLVIALGVTLSLLLLFALPPSQAFRIGLGTPFLFFFPGYTWTLALFHKAALDGLERSVLSVALSIAIMPLAVFVANRLGVPIRALTIGLNALFVVLAGTVVALLVRRRLPTSTSHQPSS